MNHTVIGIHVNQGVQQTLASVRAHTMQADEVLLLVDPGFSVKCQADPSLARIRQVIVPEPAGAAAAFNRLASSVRADIYVLLESGVIVGPDWLQRLQRGLAAQPNNGLAGPSTNRSWNPQAAFPGRAGDPASVAATAAEAALKFKDQCLTLEPLYSLADFCYAVRREVIEEVGLADEAYGLGPCWEMDYNIRAARAGWRGVWVRSAFVWRAPMTARRQREQALLFEGGKRHYQDKFCGALLRGHKTDYRSHCRGDACPNFAPLEFTSRWGASNSHVSADANEARTKTSDSGNARSASACSDTPLVTCIMPTCNRRSFVRGAIRNFLRQDYPSLELLILDDGVDAVHDLIIPDPRIRYIRMSKKQILGAKRNLACAEARGDFIVHWDDDDWYPADRVSKQIAGLALAKADICGTSTLFYYDPSAERAWLYRYGSGSRNWVAGNTLAYTRSFWEQNPFPPLQVGEDARFVWARANAKICDLSDPSLCVARVHPGNTSRKALAGACWSSWPVAAIRTLVGTDLEMFRGQASPQPTAKRTNPDHLPLVSCVMPTANRRRFVRLALRCFEQQDYPRTELIVVDDGAEDLADLIATQPNVRYLRLASRVSIGAKRNLACQVARGDFITHWDDDDWYGPERLSYQIGPFLKGEADLTGLEMGVLVELEPGRFWSVSPSLHRRMFVADIHGGTLMFRKAIFDQGARYPDISVAEDAAFIRSAMTRGGRLVRMPNPGLFVYVRHGTNVWRFGPGRFLDNGGWIPSTAPAPFLPCIREYQECVISRPEGSTCR